MQFYALDGQKTVSALEAERDRNYLCPECLRLLRVRGGPHRQIHFYHPKSNPLCTQHKKSLTHLHIQNLLEKKLPGAVMEKPFPRIGRIADIAWDQEKLIFEIQCSGMSGEEAKARCRDYAKVGYTVVFILHDKRFNQFKLSAAEHFLRQSTCLFTNIDATGAGVIYDQFDYVQGMKRLFKGRPLAVDLSKPLRQADGEKFPSLPKTLKERLKNWPLFFEGDLLHRSLSMKQSLEQIHEVEQKFSASTPSRNPLSFSRLYKTFLQYLLERACA